MDLTTAVKRLHEAGQTPKAALYARFSSENQREESIDAQIRAIREFAEKNAIVLVAEYVDKAKSATNDDRENFQAMIRDAGKGNFQFVIVHKLDRFARNRQDAVGYRVELARKGVMLVSTLENYDDSTPEGALMQGLSELLAEFYSKNLSREIKKGQRENALVAKHNGGTPPFGYDVDPDTGKLIINEAEAVGVRMMFRMVYERYGYGDIIEALKKGGYKTKRGKDFGRNSLHDILRNEKYIGVYFYRRIASPMMGKKSVNSHRFNKRDDIIIVDGGVPAIVSREQFDSVQQILNERRQKGVRIVENYILTGKVFCGCCGMPYHGSRTISRKRNYINVAYRCDGSRKARDERCGNGLVNKDKLEQKVLSGLAEIIFDPNVIPRLVEQAGKTLQARNKEHEGVVANIHRQMKAVDKKIEHILVAVESGKGSDLLLNRLDKLEGEKKSFEEQLAREKANNPNQTVNVSKLKALFAKARTMLQLGTLAGSRRLVDFFIDKILIEKDVIRIRYNPASVIIANDGAIFEKVVSRDEVRIYRKHSK